MNRRQIILSLVLIALFAVILVPSKAAPLATTNGDLVGPSTVAVNPGLLVLSLADADGDTSGAQDAWNGGPNNGTFAIVNQNEPGCGTGVIPAASFLETAANSGVFSNSATPFDISGFCFQTKGGDTLVVTYTDNEDADGDPSTHTDSINITVTSNSGTITGPSQVANGATIQVFVTDNDINTNTGARNDLNAAVTAQIAGCGACSTATLNLNETGDNTGIFSNDGANGGDPLDDLFDPATIGAGLGDTVRFTYNDADPASNTPFIDVLIGGNTPGTISAVTNPVTVGGTLTVEVIDNDINSDAGSPQALNGRVVITVDGCGACSSATIDLTETNNNTSAFRNTVGFDPTTIGATPGQTLRATYNDQSPTSNTPSVTIPYGTTSSGTVSAITNPILTTLTVQVIDNDVNTNPSTRNDLNGLVVISVQNCAACSTATINLNETGDNTGIFQNDGANGGDPLDDPFDPSTIGAVPGQNIVITYNDANPNTNKPSVTVRYGNSTEGTLNVPGTVVEGGTFVIELTDSGENTDPGNAETITVAEQRMRVSIENCAACATTFVALTEDAPNSGVFDSAAFDYTTIGAVPGQTLRVTYFDQDPSSNQPFALVRIVPAAGVLTVPSLVSVNTNLPIEVADAALNANPNAIETIPTGGAALDNSVATTPRVVATCAGCPANGIGILLTETGANTGIFTLNWDYTTAIGDPLLTDAGDTFTITYNDDNPNTNTPSQVVTITGGTNAMLDAVPRAVTPGSTVQIQLSDPDLNLSTTNIDTAVVTVQNVTLGANRLNVTVTETDVNTAFFTATFNVADAGIEAVSGHLLEVRYQDTTPAGGGNPVTLTVNVQVGPIGSDPGIFAFDTIPGRPIQITLIDPDLTGQLEVNVQVQNITNNGVVETITLIVADDGTTGRFAGAIKTYYGQGSDGIENDIIAVQGDDVVRVTYTDPLNASATEAKFSDDALVISRRTPTTFCNEGTETTNPVWNVDYYNNISFEGNPVLSVPEIDMAINWEETAPYRELPVDGFSARYQTSINVTEFGRFRFRIGADDGVRLFIDSVLYIDQFTPGSYREHFAEVDLTVGTHFITVEYFEDAFEASLLMDCLRMETAVAGFDPDGNPVDFFESDSGFEEPIAHITTGRINVRANPVVQSERIDYVYIYEQYQILGVTDDFGWYLIDLKDGRTGWVAELYVKRYEDIPVQIYPSWVGSEAALPDVEVTGQTTAEVVLRDGPRGPNEVGIVPNGATFRIYSRSGSGAWLKIEYNGTFGWVFAPYVTFTNGTVMDLPRE